MEIQQVESLLRQIQQTSQQKQTPSPSKLFADLLQESSNLSKDAAESANKFVSTGEGELHKVQMKLAKADVTFRFLVEVRNKLTEAYQEITRLPV